MKTVLVIDDNQGIRENTAEIMELAGYRPLMAENGKKGIELALLENPDIIICDIMMPDLDGYGVLHLLRKNELTQNIPFIFLTAKTEKSDYRKGMEMGADDYVTKPFEEIDLLNAVEIRLKKAEVLEKKYAMSSEGISTFLQDVTSVGLVSKLSEQYEIQSFSKKQTVYAEGKRPRFLYYLVKGKVKGFRTHEDGKDYITDVFSDGDFIGYTALLEDTNYMDSATVLEDSEIMQVPRDDFFTMIYGDIHVAIKFIHIITQNAKGKEDRLLTLAYSSLRKRVARALVDLHKKYEALTKKTTIDISREDIAHYIGTATESLIRTLSDFKAEHIIEIKDGKIIVPDIEKLKNLTR